MSVNANLYGLVSHMVVEITERVNDEAARAATVSRGATADICPYSSKAGVGRKTCSDVQNELRFCIFA